MTASHRHYLHELEKQKLQITCGRLLLFILILGLWEISARLNWINSFIFSSPSRIFRTACEMAQNGTLWLHLSVTMGETLISFLIVTVVGLLLAVLLWGMPRVSLMVEPYLVMLNSLPKSALAPLLIVWLGNSTKTIVAAAVSIAIFGSIITLYTGFHEIDSDMIRLIYTLGGHKSDVMKLVIIPASIPMLISNMKVNIGLCLVGVIIGEFLSAKAGLGYLIIYASQTFKMDWMLMSIVILCLMSTILYQGIHLLEKKYSR
jgi:NitT/TauT family transport system permease protein